MHLLRSLFLMAPTQIFLKSITSLKMQATDILIIASLSQFNLILQFLVYFFQNATPLES